MSRPNYRRRRTFAVLGLFGVVVLALVLLTRGGGGGPGASTPDLQFVAKTKHVFQGKAAGEGVQQAEVDALTATFNEYYQRAFVDPDSWGDGTFTDLSDYFAEEAQASFQRDVASLTIGEAATELERVDLGTNSFLVSIYYDGKQTPTFAVATVRFEGRGTLKETGPAVAITQAATYYLQKQGSDWKITAYDAKETQMTPTPSPSPTS